MPGAVLAPSAAAAPGHPRQKDRRRPYRGAGARADPGDATADGPASRWFPIVTSTGRERPAPLAASGAIALSPPATAPASSGAPRQSSLRQQGDFAARGHEVELLTTCARSHFSWANEFEAGTFLDRGVDGPPLPHRRGSLACPRRRARAPGPAFRAPPPRRRSPGSTVASGSGSLSPPPRARRALLGGHPLRPTSSGRRSTARTSSLIGRS